MNRRTCSRDAIRLAQDIEALAGGIGLGADRECQPADGLTQEVAPSRAEQAADQADPHVTGDFGHDRADVAGDQDADQRLQREADDDDHQDRHRLERHADLGQRRTQGHDLALGRIAGVGGRDDQRHHHGQADQVQHAGEERPDDHQGALPSARQPQHPHDRGRPLVEAFAPPSDEGRAHPRRRR